MMEADQAGQRKSLRVLHLGFEDPTMPGAGGGSVRTHEINRRIAAAGHDVTVLTTRFPGWRERDQDGVHYVPVGLGAGRSRAGRLAGYVLRLPLETWRRRRRADLVVEDFFAPFSTMAAPLWTGRPTVGVVQWLHARAKAREYRLPFDWLERAGVRRHRRLIAVSEGTAGQLRQLNPRVRIDVIGNGVDQRAFETTAQSGRDVLCVGRLELVGKGIDLLLEAWAVASRSVDGNLVIAGTGPDEDGIRRAVDAAGLADRVRFVGWISGREKFDLMATARLVVVPSRAETFGLVAVEALACSTPVIAFDIPCLREVVPANCGWTVPAFDAHALANEICQRYGATRELAITGAAGRRFASAFNWDALAERQLSVYSAVVAGTVPRRESRSANASDADVRAGARPTPSPISVRSS
jgi:glycogen synthase